MSENEEKDTKYRNAAGSAAGAIGQFKSGKKIIKTFKRIIKKG